MGRKPHLAEAFRWSSEEGTDGAAMLALGLAVSVPVLVMGLLGREALGMAVAIGGLLAGAEPVEGRFADHLRERAEGVVVVFLATAAALLVARQGWWTVAAMVAVVGLAAVIGGYSRPLAMSTGRFIVAFAIIQNVAERDVDPIAVAGLVTFGALWNAVLALAFGALFRAMGLGKPKTEQPVSRATPAQKFKRWRRMLDEFAGWRYAARLTPGFAVGGALRLAYPGHHFGWVILTVALLCRRQLEIFPVKATQRTLGVAVGVAVTWLLAGRTLAPWMLAGLVATLAGVGPWLRSQNYLAYTAVVTPLIVVLLSAGGPVDTGVLVDRLVATVIGSALVIGTNLLTTWIAPPGPESAAAPQVSKTQPSQSGV